MSNSSMSAANPNTLSSKKYSTSSTTPSSESETTPAKLLTKIALSLILPLYHIIHQLILRLCKRSSHSVIKVNSDSVLTPISSPSYPVTYARLQFSRTPLNTDSILSSLDKTLLEWKSTPIFILWKVKTGHCNLKTSSSTKSFWVVIQ